MPQRIGEHVLPPTGCAVEPDHDGNLLAQAFLPALFASLHRQECLCYQSAASHAPVLRAMPNNKGSTSSSIAKPNAAVKPKAWPHENRNTGQNAIIQTANSRKFKNSAVAITPPLGMYITPTWLIGT